MRTMVIGLLSAALLLAAGRTGALAFPKVGSGGKECRECHSLTREEAGTLLAGLVDNVLGVEPGPVQGLWEVDVAKEGRKFPIYVDFSKKYVLSARIIQLGTKEDVTGARMTKLNETKVDPSQIPLSDALVVGKPSAKRRVVVFSDPDCHFCAKLHGELRTATEKDPGVSFYIKLYSRNNSPATAEKARSIICSKSLAMLEDAYAGKALPPAICTTAAPEETLRLAGRFNIHGTPTLILPDGRVLTGYRDANALLQLLAGSQPSAEDGGKGRPAVK